jgi:hypothetical protein
MVDAAKMPRARAEINLLWEATCILNAAEVYR